MKSKPYVVKIAEEIWSSGTAEDVAEWLAENLMADADTMKLHRENVELTFSGVNEAQKPLWAYPKIAEMLRDLDTHWPYALFFFSREGRVLEALQLSVGRTEVVRGGSGELSVVHDQDTVAKRFSEVWVPKLAEACSAAGLSDKQFRESLKSALAYFERGIVGNA